MFAARWLLPSDSANPGQPDAFPNLFMAPCQGSRVTSIATSMPACPVDVDFTFTAGMAGRGRGRWKRQYGSCLACQEVASSLDVDARVPAPSMRDFNEA